jgi:hypothetical protein
MENLKKGRNIGLFRAQYRLYCIEDVDVEKPWGLARWKSTARWVGLANTGQGGKPEGTFRPGKSYWIIWITPILLVFAGFGMVAFPSGRSLMEGIDVMTALAIAVSVIAALVALVAIPASFSIGGLNTLVDRRSTSSMGDSEGLAVYDDGWYQNSAIGLYRSVVNLSVSILTVGVSVILLLGFQILYFIIQTIFRVWIDPSWGGFHYGISLGLVLFSGGIVFSFTCAFSGTIGVLYSRIKFPSDAL